LNLYAYVENDPSNETDPTGKCPMCVPIILFVLKEAAGEAFEQTTGIPAPTVKGAAKFAAKQLAKQTLKQGAKQNAVKLTLKYKSGWTSAQRAAADGKVKHLDEAAKAGELQVTAAKRSGTSARGKFERSGRKVAPKEDVDHKTDLQLGGRDSPENMWGLDGSVNRSLGSQNQHQTKGALPGTKICGVTICDPD
jgi:hypothetical protein